MALDALELIDMSDDDLEEPRRFFTGAAISLALNLALYLVVILVALLLFGCSSMQPLRPNQSSGVRIVCILARCDVQVAACNEKGAASSTAP